MEAIKIVEESLDRRDAEFKAALKERDEAQGSERDAMNGVIGELKKQVEGLGEVISDYKQRPNFAGIETTTTGEKDKWCHQRALQLVCSPIVGNQRQLENDPKYGVELEGFARGAEQREHVSMQTKASVNASSDTLGGYTIPVEVQSDILPLLETATVLGDIGVPFINDVTGNVSFVKELAAMTAYYVDSEAEENITESNLTLENVNLTPHELGALVPVTKRIMRESSPSMGQYIMKRMVTKLGQVEDQKYFLGTGSNSEPLGLTNEAGMLGEAFTSMTIGPAVDITTQFMMNMVKDVENAHGNVSNGTFVTGVNGKYLTMSIEDANGNKKHLPSSATLNTVRGAGAGQHIPVNVMGYPMYGVASLNHATTTTENLWFGDFQQRPVWRWGSISLEAATQHATDFAKGRISIRGWMAHDFISLQDVFCEASVFDSTKANI